jgi:hypothetical protein
MSGLQVVKTIDPSLNVQDPTVWKSATSAKVISAQQLSATSYGPTNTNSWTLIPGNGGYVIERAASIEWDFAVSISNIDGGTGTLSLTDGTFSLAQDPIDRAANTIKITVNSQPITNSNPFYLRYLKDLSVDMEATTTVGSALTMPDQSQTYAAMVGSVRNPLASYRDSIPSDSVYQPRGVANDLFTNFQSSGGTASFNLKLVEPINQDPFLGAGQGQGFMHINQLGVEYTFYNLSLMFSSTKPGLVFDITMPTPPKLLTYYYTPQPNQPLPQMQKMNYAQYQIQQSSAYTIANGASETLTINNITMGNIPEFLLLIVKRSRSDDAYNKTDCPIRIDSLRVNFNNSNVLLSDLSSFQLWEMSRKAGLNYTWAAWRKYRGSVLVIPAEKLNLNEDQIPGCSQVSTNLSCEVVATNISGSQQNFILTVIPVLPGIATNGRDLNTQLSLAPISAEEVLRAPYAGSTRGIKYGGGVFDILKTVIPFLGKTKLISTVGDALSKSGIPVLSDIAGPISGVAKSLGFGYKRGGRLVPDDYLHEM